MNPADLGNGQIGPTFAIFVPYQRGENMGKKFFQLAALTMILGLSLSAQAYWDERDIRDFLSRHTCYEDIYKRNAATPFISRNLNEDLANDNRVGFMRGFNTSNYTSLAVSSPGNDVWLSLNFYITFTGHTDRVDVRFSRDHAANLWTGWDTTLDQLVGAGIRIKSDFRSYHFYCHRN
jgi:hypothetical protein